MNIKLSSTLIYSVFMGCLFSTNTAFSEIYKWKDLEGNIRYSDIPPETSEGTNIEEVNIKNRVNTYSNDNSKPLLENKVDTQYEQEVKEKTIDYKKQVDRAKDEDVSDIIKQFKRDAKANTTDNPNTENTDTDNPAADSPVQNNNSDTKESVSPAVEPQGKNQSTDLPTTAKEIRQAKNCSTAQENLKKLTHNNIIVSENKKLQKLSSSQIENKIKEAKSQIGFYC